jgi:hypothetical protein
VDLLQAGTGCCSRVAGELVLCSISPLLTTQDNKNAVSTAVLQPSVERGTGCTRSPRSNREGRRASEKPERPVIDPLVGRRRPLKDRVSSYAVLQRASLKADDLAVVARQGVRV